MNCGIVESGDLVDSCVGVGVGVGVELLCGLDDRLIGRVDNCAVVVVVVAVVVSSMPMKFKCKSVYLKFKTWLHSSLFECSLSAG